MITYSPETIARIISAAFIDLQRPACIAIGGPGGCGKTTFCSDLHDALPESSILTLDDYRLPRNKRHGRILYGSHPDANRIDLLVAHLEKLKQNEPVDKPIYDSVNGTSDTTEPFMPSRYILLDGEISTYELLRSHIDFSIFIDADLQTQFTSRMNRDMQKPGYTHEKVMSVFKQSNIKDFTEFGIQAKPLADIRLFCNSDYSLRIDSVSDKVDALCKDVKSSYLGS